WAREPPVSAAELFVATWIVIVPIVTSTVLLAPIEGLRIIKTKADPLRFALRCQIRHWVVFPWCRIHDVVSVHFRWPHREAVVMFGGNDDVAHSGLLRETDPFVRVEISWIKRTGDFLTINRNRNLQHALNVLGVTPTFLAVEFVSQTGVDAP